MTRHNGRNRRDEGQGEIERTNSIAVADEAQQQCGSSLAIATTMDACFWDAP
jgi:hypothetical protein